jgi:hypothetical protein
MFAVVEDDLLELVTLEGAAPRKDPRQQGFWKAVRARFASLPGPGSDRSVMRDRSGFAGVGMARVQVQAAATRGEGRRGDDEAERDDP